jgi:outer membrane protein assembly factor BamE
MPDRSARSGPAFWSRLTAAALGALLVLAASGCVYRINIQQGNYLEAAVMEQLSVGMTRSQVRYLLGTPILPDAFDHDRWDYVFYFKRGRLRDPEQRRVTVYFEDDKVSRIERPGAASGQVATAEPTK